MRLRDIEVANDDFERQARNTTSSLEDLESKYNVAIERGVMFEEEIKAGEQEREALRIETQRLRDELSDLRVEAEVRQGKLRNVAAAASRERLRKPTPLDHNSDRPPTRGSQHSPTTSTSSPTIATPPTKSTSSTISETPTPPSPPNSDLSAPVNQETKTKTLPRSRLSIAGSSTTPRPSTSSSRLTAHSRDPSFTKSSKPLPRRSTIYRQDPQNPGPGLTASGSLHQIRGLIGKMQRLEQRVNSARSKLPAPTGTPPRASPRTSSALGSSYIPPTITVRSNRKRTGGSNAASAFQQPPEQPQRPQSRLSFGIPLSSPNRGANTIASRPSSRASITSRPSISHLPSAGAVASTSSSRPGSRQSVTGAHTPLGHYSSTSSMSESRRPRSSIGGSYGATHYGHGQSASVSRLSNYSAHNIEDGGEDESSEVLTPTPARRGTLGKTDQTSGIPAFSAGTAKRRISGLGPSRRISSSAANKGREEGDMGPPERKLVRKLSGVGETF